MDGESAEFTEAASAPIRESGALAGVTAEGVADAIAADIFAQRLTSGEMLPSERKLCERFGVGRNVVREAMTLLAGRQLTDLSKGKRPRVVVPTLARVLGGMTEAAQYFFIGNEGKAHLEQARLFLETSLVSYAIGRITNAQIARMVSAIEECDAHIAEAAAFRRADVKFHRVLAEVPGNPIFVALHEAFVERMMINRPDQENVEARNRISSDEHKQLIKAMLAGDRERAIAILTRHLSRNYETYLLRSLGHAGLSEAGDQTPSEDQQSKDQDERVEDETLHEADGAGGARGAGSVRGAGGAGG